LGLLYNIIQYIKAIQDMREMTHAVFHTLIDGSNPFRCKYSEIVRLYFEGDGGR
jgi:hypothetical protein